MFSKFSKNYILFVLFFLIFSFFPLNIGKGSSVYSYFFHFTFFFIFALFSETKEEKLFLFFLSFVKEVVQFYIPWRTFSLYDILFDLLGIFTGLLVFKVILKNSYKRFKFIGSVFGIGLILPAWKGTFSALVALCILILIDINPFTAFISLIYIYLLHFVLRKDIRDKDPDYFTIDEVAGILPLFFIKTEPFLYVTGYIIFRILDIKKPFFIKKTERIKGFNGVFLDDLLSGIIALIFIYIIKFIFI